MGKRVEANGSGGAPGPAWAAWITLFVQHMRNGTHATTERKSGPSGTSWTQDELAEATGFGEDGKTNVRRESISRYRTAKDLPSEESVRRLAKALFGDDLGLAEQKAAFLAFWRLALHEREDARAIDRSSRDSAPTMADERPTRHFGHKRKDQVEELAALLAGPGPDPVSIIVLGDGGIGKTTLKREVAHHDGVKARFRSRIFEARLDTAPGVTAMQNAIAVAAVLDPRLDLDALLNGLTDSGPTLLLLDNLETPWDAETKPVELLLRRLAAVPGLTLLASLRGRVAPLGPLWTRQLLLSPLEELEARAMFRAHAPSIAEDDLYLAPFLAELGGNPLAIRLVAGRAAPHATLADLWADWQALGPKLAWDSGVPEGHRHASLANSIEFSLASSRLDEKGRRLFRLLGALPAGIARVDRVALFGVEEASDGTGQLLRLGLAHAQGDRLDLLPPIRRHAARHHPSQGDDARGWALYLLGLAAELRQHFYAHGSEVMARLRPELPNLEAALRCSAEEPDFRNKGLLAAWTYTQVCAFSGLGAPALSILATACRNSGDFLNEAHCLSLLGDVALARFDLKEAESRYDSVLALVRQVGSLRGEAICMHSQGQIALHRSEYAKARSSYEAALELYRQIYDRQGEANCIQNLGDIALYRSDYIEALSRYDEALPLYRQLIDLLGEANCIQSLGDLALRRSEPTEARTRYEAALLLYRQVGSVLGEANALRRLADIARAEGRIEQARSGYREALAMEERIGATHNATFTRARLAALDE